MIDVDKFKESLSLDERLKVGFTIMEDICTMYSEDKVTKGTLYSDRDKAFKVHPDAKRGENANVTEVVEPMIAKGKVKPKKNRWCGGLWERGKLRVWSQIRGTPMRMLHHHFLLAQRHCAGCSDNQPLRKHSRLRLSN